MATVVIDPVVVKTKDFSGKRFNNVDFSGQDLRGAKFRGADCTDCSFVDADLSNADFEGANCFGSDFTNAKCNRTNFKDAVLAGTAFFPADVFGMTLSLRCETFDGMKTTRMWWWCWLYFALLMVPKDNEKEGLHEILIKAMGTERYLRLRRLFPERAL
jgi:hypothetical protein